MPSKAEGVGPRLAVVCTPNSKADVVRCTTRQARSLPCTQLAAGPGPHHRAQSIKWPQSRALPPSPRLPLRQIAAQAPPRTRKRLLRGKVPRAKAIGPLSAVSEIMSLLFRRGRERTGSEEPEMVLVP